MSSRETPPPSKPCGIYNSESSPTLVRCLFVNNSAIDVGAIDDVASTSTITNCTFTQNQTSDEVSGFSPTIHDEQGSQSVITNCILWNDFVGQGGAEIAGAAIVTYSDVQGGYTGTGNIDADPLFDAAANNNFQLQPTSPCINIGNNSAPGLQQCKRRLGRKTSQISEGVVDMGSYEAVVVSPTWTGQGDGTNWSDPANWSDDLVPTQQDNVTIPAGFNTIQIGPGIYTVDFLTANSPVEVTSGTLLLIGQSTFNAGLTIDSGATVQLVADPTVLVVTGLSIAAGGTLDLADNSMIVRDGDLSAITALIATGFNGGFWNGAGIVSSTAMGSRNTALGIELGSDGQGGKLFTTFGGQPVSSTDVLVKYTYYGDADLSGVVDAIDYELIDNGFNMGLAGWSNGDFNYDGVINGDDYTLIDNAYNTQGSNVQVLARGLPAADAAEIASPSSVSPSPNSGTQRGSVAAVFNPIAGDTAESLELKKRHAGAWERLESAS